MAYDLNFPVKVIGANTIREKNGLAMSSRNEYLNPEERVAASSIYAGLLEAKRLYGQGIVSVAKLKGVVKERIERAGGKVQYIEIADNRDLMPVKVKVLGKVVILLACYFGKTRLIDHIEVP